MLLWCWRLSCNSECYWRCYCWYYFIEMTLLLLGIVNRLLFLNNVGSQLLTNTLIVCEIVVFLWTFTFLHVCFTVLGSYDRALLTEKVNLHAAEKLFACDIFETNFTQVWSLNVKSSELLAWGPGSLQGRGNFGWDLPANSEVWRISGVGQSYLVCVSSSAAFSCYYCSKLFIVVEHCRNWWSYT